jgi:hypothetical protein
MSDRDEILNLMARYCHTYDDGELETWVELFRYGSYTFMGKTFTGVHEIGDWIIPTSVRRGTRHVVFNQLVEVDGERATARSDFITVPRDPTGVLKVDSPEAVWGRYDDTFTRREGRWWFEARVVTVDNEAQMVATWAWMREHAAVYVERREDLYQ